MRTSWHLGRESQFFVSFYFFGSIFLRGQRTILGMPPLAHLHGRNQYAPIQAERADYRFDPFGGQGVAFKTQIPNPKIQTSSKFQIPKSRAASFWSLANRLMFGLWCLFGIWSLGFGISALNAARVPECIPASGPVAPGRAARAFSFGCRQGWFSPSVSRPQSSAQWPEAQPRWRVARKEF